MNRRLRQFLAEMRQESKFSPDLAKIEESEFRLLFAPDETQPGRAYHKLIEESALVAPAFTRRLFNFYQKRGDFGSTPIPMHATGPTLSRFFPPSLPIKGQLLAVRSWQFKNLDTHKQNGVQFQRQRVQVIVPYRDVMKFPTVDVDGLPLPDLLLGKDRNVFVSSTEKVVLVRALMYVGIPNYWDDLFDAGYSSFISVPHYDSRRPWLREGYYDYPPHDLSKNKGR